MFEPRIKIRGELPTADPNGVSCPYEKSGISGSGCYYLLNHLAKLLQKNIASQKTNTSHDVVTIFCNHLAKLLLRL